MAATWYLCYVMPSMQHYYHSGVSSFAAADLVHVGCKGICNIRTPVVAYQNHPHRNDHKVTLQTSTQSRLITCQNFQFWQVCSSDGLSVCLLLAKIFNFGKYVRLTVCYLPKLLWNFASMFVWRFVTCQNFFEILQVCSSDGLLLAKIFNFGKYVRLTVCLSVFLSVCLSAWTLWTRYRPHRLTNHHQTWHKYGPLVRTEPYCFSRSKVK